MLLKAVAALSNLVVPLMIAVICIAGYAKKSDTRPHQTAQGRLPLQ